MKKKLIILGSSGSIGVNTLNVVREFPDLFEVSTLTVNTNIELLKKQIAEYSLDLSIDKDYNFGMIQALQSIGESYKTEENCGGEQKNSQKRGTKEMHIHKRHWPVT